MLNKNNAKKVLGVLLVLMGLLALVTPLTPGTWLLIIGLELLGIRILMLDKIMNGIRTRLAGGMVSTQALARFMRYTAVGVSTFLLDLAMLYGAVHFVGIPYYIATPISFLLAVSCNYAISRSFVFRETKRSWGTGYAYFIFVALAGAAATTALVSALVVSFDLFYLYARVLVAGIVGITNYLINLHLNFKVVGTHKHAVEI